MSTSDLLENYYALFAAAPNLMELLRKKDKAKLGTVGRLVLDASAPDDWCWWEILRTSQEWSRLRGVYRGLHRGIRSGLMQPPAAPTPECVLGLLLNDVKPTPTKTEKAEAATAGLLNRLSRKR